MAMTLHEALLAALEDEYHARATYRAVIAAFGEVRPFVNIVESEERHARALERLCRAHGVAVPTDRWAGRAEPPRSLAAACQSAIDAERENAALYERLLEAARGHPDVEQTFRRLLEASQERHLPAFERALERARTGGPVVGAGGMRRRRRCRRHE